MLWLAAGLLGLALGFLLGILWTRPQSPRSQQPSHRGELKMVLLVRTDLGMQKGLENQ